MELNINANDFCPDDCPFVEPIPDEEEYGEYKCKNRELCKYAHSLQECEERSEENFNSVLDRIGEIFSPLNKNKGENDE